MLRIPGKGQSGQQLEGASQRRSRWDSRHVLLYSCVGMVFAVLMVGASLIGEPAWLKGLSRDLAIAIGPVWVLGLLYQHFLFKEIREASTAASADALLEQAQPLIDSITQSAREVQTEVESMMHMRELGIERALKKRRDAFPMIAEWLRAEKDEIAVVGTSLRGLFWEELGRENAEIKEILAQRLAEPNRTCRFKFLLIHPSFAHLRQSLERLHRPEDFKISQEIRTSVERLLDMGAEPEEIHFVKAPPTCFALKTSNHMLINPYPLENQAMASFCLIVGNHEGRNRIYSDFADYHFVFDSANSVPLTGRDREHVDLIFGD